MSALELSSHAREALLLAAILSVPIAAIAFVAGLAVSVVQSATQAHDPAVAHLPKLVAVGAGLLVLAPWMAGALIDFTRRVLEAAAR